MSKPELSVVILTCNRPERCVKVVIQTAALLGDIKSEIIVVNNGKPLSDIPKSFRNIECTVLQMPTNIGISARNKGWQAARGDYVLMLDDDVEIGPGTIEAAQQSFKTHPNAGITAFKINDVDGREESCLLPVVFHGCACAFRRTALEACGGYPDNFGFYVEEYDLAFHVFKKGYKIVFAESYGAVTHFREQKNRDHGKILYFLVRNNAYLCAAHLPAPMVLPALADILTRCFLVARKEKVFSGYLKGLLSIPASLMRGLSRRNAFEPELFREISLIAPMRRAADEIVEKNFESTVICGVGRFPSLWIDVLKQAGIKKITFWENNICWKNRKIKGMPVLMPDQINAGAYEKTAFITGSASRADNRLWNAWLDEKGLANQSFALDSKVTVIAS